MRKLKQHLTKTTSFVLVASDFSCHPRSLHFLNLTLHELERHGIVFDHSAIVDYEITPEEANTLIQNADLVLLSGGSTLKQIASIREYGLEEALRDRAGVTFGISAGAINMAQRVVLAKNINDDKPELSIYNGIGLVDFSIEPHLNELTAAHIAEIQEAAKHAPIYGLYDESFILVVNGEKEFYGACRLFGAEHME